MYHSNIPLLIEKANPKQEIWYRWIRLGYMQQPFVSHLTVNAICQTLRITTSEWHSQAQTVSHSECTPLKQGTFNPSNAELNPICHLLTLLGSHHILHIGRIRVKTKWGKSANIYQRITLINHY